MNNSIIKGKYGFEVLPEGSNGTSTGRVSSSEPQFANPPMGSGEAQRITAAFRPKIAGDVFTPGHISITASPRFYISLAVVHIGYLMAMSNAHYDHRCKAAGSNGGFIYGWNNWSTHAPDARHGMSLDELDTLLKICENIRVLHGEAKIAEVRLLVRLLSRAWEEASKACAAIDIELMPDTLTQNHTTLCGWSPY